LSIFPIVGATAPDLIRDNAPDAIRVRTRRRDADACCFAQGQAAPVRRGRIGPGLAATDGGIQARATQRRRASIASQVVARFGALAFAALGAATGAVTVAPVIARARARLRRLLAVRNCPIGNPIMSVVSQCRIFDLR
jgi:hypothetical protein